MDSEPYVDATTVAEFLSTKRRQVLEMTRRGLIPAHPLGIGRSRRIWRFKLSEVDAAVNSCARKPASFAEGSGLAQNATQSRMPVGSPGSQRRKL
jgi:excisionase family DNA binding protein